MSGGRAARFALPLACAIALAPGVRAASPAPAPGFHAPAPVVRTLANGLTVAVFQDDRQPLVQMQLLVPAGSIEESPGESGLANLTFQMLGHGTASRTAAAFDDAVQALGGTVGGAVSREFATVNGTFLSVDMEAGLELLADAVVNPLFGDDVLRAIKAQAVGGLLNARQDPATLADEHLWSAVFSGHPYGAPALGAPRVLGALSVAQVQVFHRQHYRPDRALLAIAGDVTPERAFKVAEDLLGSWGGHASAGPVAALPPAERGMRVRIVDVPQAARAELRLGAVGPAHAEHDYAPIAVAGELLAARSEPGLHVTVSGLRAAGLFSVAWPAPVDSVTGSLARVRAALVRAAQEPPSDGDLEAARRRLTGGYTLQFDTRGGLMAQWMAAMLYARAGERLFDYPDQIAALTAGGVRDAFARRIAPDRMVLVAVGPADRLRPQLEGLGPVEIVPAEAAAEVVETPSTARGAATSAQIVRGRALVGQAAAAHGGLERLRSIKDSTIEGEIDMSSGTQALSGRILQVRKDPERFRFETTFSVLKSLQVLDGASGWSRAGDPPAPIEDLDSVSVSGLRSGFRSDIVHLLLAAADPAARVAWRGTDRRDDREADVVEVVSPDGERRLLFLDATTHRLVASEQNDGGRSVRRIYRDLRDASGVLWPFYEERFLDGQRAVTLTLSRVALNTGVEDALFVKPGASPPRRPRAR